jgi:transcriptional regulator with PAS, ATPase and Fis domain
MNDIPWTEALGAAVTVIGKDGIILQMNARARDTFASEGGGALVGQSVYDCHPESAQRKLRQMMQSQQPNHYTISKRGQRKIIHQMPWFQDGAFAGIVELSIPIPEPMEHFDRG